LRLDRSRDAAEGAGVGAADFEPIQRGGAPHRPTDVAGRASAAIANTTESEMRAGRNSGERLAMLEQKVSHMEEALDKISAKVDEMHVFLQARGVRWAIIAVSGLVGFVTGISHWLVSRA
jgi:hypothetical protein